VLSDLVTRAGNLPAIPVRAAQAYAARADFLVGRAYQDLAARREVAPIRRREGLEVLEGNFQNHALLMSSAMALNDFTVLARTLPWSYRVFAVRGVDLDYFPLQWATWRRAVADFLSPALAGPITDVYDWLQAEHEAVAGLWRDPETFLFAPGGPPGELERKLTDLLLQGRRRACLNLAREAIRSLEDLRRFYQCAQNALYRVGERWEWGLIHPGDEHVATAGVLAVMAAHYPRVARSRVRRGLALVACVPGELHDLGSRMVADFLEMDGWEVIGMGANVPQEGLVQLARHARPNLLALSVNSAFNLGRAKRVIEVLQATPDLRHLRILVGGMAVNRFPGAWRRLNAHAAAEDAAGAAALATTWFAREA